MLLSSGFNLKHYQPFVRVIPRGPEELQNSKSQVDWKQQLAIEPPSGGKMNADK
jgi:hypothetical protein